MRTLTNVLLVVGIFTFAVNVERVVSDLYGRLDALASRQAMLEDEAARAFWRGRVEPAVENKLDSATEAAR